MPNPNPNPTILIIPGSFAPPSIYDPLVALFKERGFPAVALALPSTQKRMPLPPATLADDVGVVRGVAEVLLGLGREVVALCHSYGGTPTTEALAGLPIKRIIYLSAVAPKIGETHIEAMALPEGSIPPATDGYLHIDAIQMTPAVLNDLPFEDAYPLVRQLAHHSAIAFSSPTTQAAYKDVPVSYIVCEKDLIIAPDVQRRFIRNIEEGKGEGGKVHVVSLQAGHCPNWSVPGELVDVVVECVGRE
ncbi:alpha/beta-hydrolase [Pyrenochaeta sp. DS3sAY3a]|nr:alpha/beta-hydrolase [Pyrenochaeta sp. DS3sAY3a]